MKDKITIEAVMHSFPYTIGADQSLQTAKEMMQEYGVRHLPVKDGGDLVGVISERDIHFVLAFDRKEAGSIVVRDALTEDPYLVERDTPVEAVARRMAQDRIGCALVGQKGKLVGIFTTVDACRVLAEALSGQLKQ